MNEDLTFLVFWTFFEDSFKAIDCETLSSSAEGGLPSTDNYSKGLHPIMTSTIIIIIHVTRYNCTLYLLHMHNKVNIQYASCNLYFHHINAGDLSIISISLWGI